MILKYIILLQTVLIGSLAIAQHTVRGIVTNNEKEVLIGASIRIAGTSTGTITDTMGKFELADVQHSARLVVSFVGYQSDTISITSAKIHNIVLNEDTEKLDDIVITGRTSSIDEMKPILNELITEKELLKAACCNLSESFETNASVDVSMTDAVSGAKMIRMLGLDGRYVLISREGIPHIRGLNSRYGLTYIPGTWIQSIDVGKGAGSVINGYESMTGQINLEFKKPEDSETWYFNAYLNSFGRMELNVNHAVKLSDIWSTAFLVHGNYLGNEMEGNDDGFMDMPKSRQFNILNRYKYQGERIVSQIGFQYMIDDNAGGQLGYNFGDDLLTSQVYGFKNTARRAEVYGKVGLLFPQKPFKGWGLQYSLAYQDFDGGAGRRVYSGTEKTAYGNLIYQNIIGDTRHQYKSGISYLFDGFDEKLKSMMENDLDSVFARNESVPGLYYEYNYIPDDKFTLVAGYRIDFHNLYGVYNTPRIHLRYAPVHHVTFRASAGKGYRTPNAIMENTQVLVSSRRLIFQDTPKPEVSWNYGGSIVTHFDLLKKPVNLVLDYFYTDFINQLIYDQDQSPSTLVVYNLDGQSFAHSFQAEAQYELAKYLNMKVAYKYYDVRMNTNGILQPVPYISRDRYFMNLSYITDYDKWHADLTWVLNGPGRLPDTSQSASDFQRDAYSPWFMLVNAQFSRGFRWGNVYIGAENLLDFKQKNPIVDPENPFGDNFDASMVWGPVAGRMIYTGIRYKIR